MMDDDDGERSREEAEEKKQRRSREEERDTEHNTPCNLSIIRTIQFQRTQQLQSLPVIKCCDPVIKKHFGCFCVLRGSDQKIVTVLLRVYNNINTDQVEEKN